jgi:hypothetical protein
MKPTAFFMKGMVAACVLVVPTAALGHTCDGAITAEIGKIGIAQAEIEKISVERIKSGDDRMQGYKARVSLKGKSGSLVIDMHDIKCLPRQVYTRGGLKIPGVKSF